MLPVLTPERRRSIAELAGVREQYLYQVLRGLKTPAPALARKLNSLDAELRLQDLRPDDWREIWPELVDKEEKISSAHTGQAQAAINSEARQQAQEVAGA